MHPKPADYAGSKFFTTLNNIANISQGLGTITPYNTIINFNESKNKNVQK